MANMEKIAIIGNVGKDAETRMTPNGKAVTEFSVAVNSGRGDKETTHWYRVSCWGKSGETAAQYVRKGMGIYVEGRFDPRDYTDKDGNARVSYDIKYAEFQMLGKPGERSAGGGAPPPPAAGQFDPDEIPF